MEDMEKSIGETKAEKTGDLEINQKMAERADDIDNATYHYLAELLELDENDPEEKFPWNIEILRKAFDGAVSTLQEHGYAVCNPHIAISESGRQYLCTLSECRCKKCSCQDEFMEKDRILSSIENAVVCDGLKVLDGDDNSVIVRNSRLDMDFEISIKRIEE